MAGGMHGRGCAWQGGDMHGREGTCMAGGHVMQGACMHGRGVCMAGGCVWHMVNERAVCILLECILVYQ